MLGQAIDLTGVGNVRELGEHAIGEARVKEGVLLCTAGLAHMTSEMLGERYGSAEGCLREELGVGERERERPRSVFLA